MFWADRVLELDAINPQLAARLARAMDRWSHLAEPYRSAAREAIARVAAQADAVRRRARDRVARPRRSLSMASRKPRRKNAFYAQSGGVTAVINASAAA